MIEHAAHHLSADNTELACAFIQKTAVEKVIPEMEKRLADVRLDERALYTHSVHVLYILHVHLYIHVRNNAAYMCM